MNKGETSTISLLPSRTARISKGASIIQDENKAPVGKAADKKVVKQRNVLGDISNVTTNKVVAKAKIEKPQIQPQQQPTQQQAQPSLAAAGRVRIFHKTERPAPNNVSAIPTAKSALQASQKLLEVPDIDLTKADEVLVDVKEASEEFDEESRVDLMAVDTDDQIEDIDAVDRNDPICCTEYVNEIFAYCRKREVQDRLRVDYMGGQTDINDKMRAILVDWLVEVHLKFRLLSETMFLTVNLIDRFLAIKPVTRNKLQLVGITAMLLACKYEEIHTPEVRDFVHVTDRAYSREEILRMERLMLTMLDFNMSASTPLHFLRRISKASFSDSRTHTLSKYLSELTLTEYSMLKYLPSQIAAASVYVARSMTGREPWNPTLVKYSLMKEEEFVDCARELNAVLRRTLSQNLYREKTDKGHTLNAVFKKYCSDRLLSVAKLPAVDIQ